MYLNDKEKLIKNSSFYVRFTKWHIPILFIILVSIWLFAYYHYTVGVALSIIAFFLIPILIEKSIIKERKRLGFPIWGDAREHYKLKIEDNIKKDLGINDTAATVDKSDIRYWHGLFKDGIISEEEFEGKKKDLM